MIWPRTEADHRDREWFERHRDAYQEHARLWERHEICGCGDYLEDDEEKRDGVCWACAALGIRTAREAAG